MRYLITTGALGTDDNQFVEVKVTSAGADYYTLLVRCSQMAQATGKTAWAQVEPKDWKRPLVRDISRAVQKSSPKVEG